MTDPSDNENALDKTPDEPRVTGWADVANTAVRGAVRTVWRLIDRERLGIACVFLVLFLLGGVAMILAVKMPPEAVAPVLTGIIDLIGRQWAVGALALSVVANVAQSWNYRRLRVTMQAEIDRQAAEKRDLQLLITPQLTDRTSVLPLEEAHDDD